MKPKKTFSVYVLLVGVMGLSIVGGILVFQIFSAVTKSQLTSIQKDIIKPIDGSINQKIVDNLEKRISISDQDIGGLQLIPILTPTPILFTQISSESAVINQP